MHVRQRFNKHMKSVLRERSCDKTRKEEELGRRRRLLKGGHTQTPLIPRAVKAYICQGRYAHRDPFQGIYRSMCKSHQFSFHKILKPTSG